MDRDLVRHLRATLGLTQKDLAERLGLSQCTVSRWERGTTRPDPETRRRLQDLLNSVAPAGEAALRQMVGHSPAAMALVDADWRLNAVSPAFAALLGITPVQAVGADLRRRFAAADLEQAGRAALDRGLLTGGTTALRVICALRRPDGVIVPTLGSWHAVPVQGQQRPLVVWQCVPVSEAEYRRLRAAGPPVMDLEVAAGAEAGAEPDGG
ncbi:helix-turn-helix domain-containing protein [Caenispirillum bisanense]|uniref:helix-turn-helix domain-containing protein n=1 Tax=Caenispirillum bisanense TaxID=414052 RepID=UPI0031DA6600